VSGQLYTVSDKHPHSIFTLKILPSQVVEAEEAWAFHGPDHSDLEAIGYDEALQRFYLADERKCQVLSFDPATQKLDLIGTSWRLLSQDRGLFCAFNAGIEGLTVIGDGNGGAGLMILLAERDPRGYVIARRSDPQAPWEWSRSVVMESSALPVTDGRTLDFSGACTWQGRLFALQRNHHRVVELKIHQDLTLSELQSWSFEGTERDPKWAFQDQTYGLAEGLAISETELYIVFDNNGDVRRTDPKDRRPLLARFQHPW
jgi:hypothetical protein